MAVKLRGNPDHPYSAGELCPKVNRFLDRVYSPDRILHPLRRRASGDFERISWDQALDLVAKGLHQVKRDYGPEAVWFHKGSGHDLCGGDVRPYLHRLANVFGTPNLSCPFYICNGPRTLNMFSVRGPLQM